MDNSIGEDGENGAGNNVVNINAVIEKCLLLLRAVHYIYRIWLSLTHRAEHVNKYTL